MVKANKPSLSLRDRLEAAERVALAAKHFHEVWYYYKRERPNLIKTMRRFENFFVRDIQAHFFSFVVTIYLLQDRKGGVDFGDLTKGVTDDVGKNGTKRQIDNLAEARSILKRWTKTAEKFRKLRNNVIAHMNRDDPPSAWYKEVGLVYSEACDYGAAMLKVAHLLLGAHDPPYFDALDARSDHGEESPLPDVQQFFDTLARGLAP